MRSIIKIAIIIPIMAPEVAKDWKHVQYCLNRTLRSILNSKAVNVRIYVICQSRPTDMLNHDQVRFLKSDCPIPDAGNQSAKRRDKGKKIQIGFKEAAEFEPDYIMQVDADDIISNNLFEHISKFPGYDAYIVNCGFEWWEGRKSMTIRHHFHKYCGSTFIAKYNAELFPFWIGNKSPDVTPRVCDDAHNLIEDSLLVGRFKVYYLNKPMVIYLSGGTDHLRDRGDKILFRRILKDWIFSLFRNRRINQSLREEYAMKR